MSLTADVKKYNAYPQRCSLMPSILTKTNKFILILLMVTCASYFVTDRQEARPVLFGNKDNSKVKISMIHHDISVHPPKKSPQHLSVPEQSRQMTTDINQSSENWLANFKSAYPANEKTIRAMITGIRAELRSEFIEKLLQQVQFMAESDPVRITLEYLLIVKLTDLAPSRAADYVLAKLELQTQNRTFSGFQTSNDPLISIPSQQFVANHQLISTLMPSWGEKDLPQAIEWAMALQDEQLKHEALNLLIYSRDDQKLEKMADVINRMPEGKIRSSLLSQLAGQKAQIDPDSAVAWVSSWPDSTERNRAISALISSRTSQSLEAAADLVEQVLYAGMSPDDTSADMLINQWHYKSHDDAYQWAKNLPESAVKNRFLMLLRTLNSQDIE